jgi:hypothetical protein
VKGGYEMKKEMSSKKRARWMRKYFKRFLGREKGDLEEILQKDFQIAIERAHQLLSIKPEDYQNEQPVLITVPDSFTKYDKVTYRLDTKSNGNATLHYDQSLVTTLFFGQESLFYHQCNIDHRDGRFAMDIAGEFRYFDVVHVETAIKYDDEDKPKYLILDLEVSLTDGTIIPIHLRNHRLHDTYELPGLLTDQEKLVLETLKKHIRLNR